MGCNPSKNKHDPEDNAGARDYEYNDEFAMIMKLVQHGDGSRLFELYRMWPVDAEPIEIRLPDESTRLSWPRTWEEVEQDLLNLHTACGEDDRALSQQEVDAIKACTVGNAKKSYIDEECVTWPSIQQLFRDAWVAQHKNPWRSEEHQAGMDWFVLLRENTLMLKTNGLTQALKELKKKDAVEFIWQVFVNWPTEEDGLKEVTRNHRKTGMAGQRKTWPLKWEAADDGAPSVVQLLKECEWNAVLIEALYHQLFKNKGMSNVHANCTESEVCWSDIQ